MSHLIFLLARPSYLLVPSAFGCLLVHISSSLAHISYLLLGDQPHLFLFTFLTPLFPIAAPSKYLSEAFLCFIGQSPPDRSTDCSPMPYPYLVYIAFNLCFNTAILFLVKWASSVLSFMVMRVLPLLSSPSRLRRCSLTFFLLVHPLFFLISIL